MKHVLRIIFVGLGALFVSPSTSLANANEPNLFNADTSHPDLAAAISAFEQVCMPFVLHQTEMDREHDKRHMAKLMQSRGYAFQTSAQETKHVLIEPKREPWKPTIEEQNRAAEARKVASGQFTIFNGVSTQVITSVESIIKPQPGEIMGVQIPAKYKRVLIETETYGDLNEPRLTAHMGWNYHSQNHPGKSCEIRLDQPKIDIASFTVDFIEKDADWAPKDGGWTQCVTEGEDQFRFEVSRTPQTLAISMLRNDFYTPNICN